MAKLSMPEENKRAGVCYAVTSQGIELPVVDVTHPAFQLSISDAELRTRVENFVREGPPLGRLPKPIRSFVLRLLLRGSFLADGIQRSRGSFMNGMDTYLLKLGPEMLGRAYSKPIDRKIAESLPALGVRLRLQDMARLAADTLSPALAAASGRPLHFVNIAGGPAIDSLNALILLNSEHPGILDGRPVSIDVLDLDDAGPAFGRAAVNALTSAGGPLRGLSIDFRHVRYDWANAAELKRLLNSSQANGPITFAESEGGLFEYGSDHEVKTNLEALRSSPEVLAVAGSVTRADGPTRQLHQDNPTALHPRGLPAFRDLVRGAGWNVDRAIERPFSDHVLLTRSA